MGNTCKSMAASCQCMAKTTCKVISLQLIKINEKKKKHCCCSAMSTVTGSGLPLGRGHFLRLDGSLSWRRFTGRDFGVIHPYPAL